MRRPFHDLNMNPSSEGSKARYPGRGDQDTMGANGAYGRKITSIMDIVTNSLLNEFISEFELSGFQQSQQFEIMAAYLAVKRNYSESFNPTDISTGGGSDLGIDSIAMIVNGNLVADIESLLNILESRQDYIDVTFIFVQADRGSFDGAKISSFMYGIEQFFNVGTQEPRNDAIKEAMQMMEEIYKKGGKFKNGNPRCLVYYVTTGTWPPDGALQPRVNKGIESLKELNAFREVEFHPVGRAELNNLYRLSKNAITRNFSFSARQDVPEIPGVEEAFVGFIPAREFLSIVKDDNGGIVKSIFYDNVRDDQGDNDVNLEMTAALSSDRRRRFVLMNNGVTIITRGLNHTRDNFVIRDFQIVNGCQTSHVLYRNQENIDGTVMVPLRLIWTQDEDVITDIIRATNRQTEVKEDQFFASTDFARELEAYFLSQAVTERLYFERRSRQYDSLDIEKTRVINQTNVVRAFAAIFLEEPHSTVRSYNTLSERIGNEIFGSGHKMISYYTASFAFYRLDRLFHNGSIDRKYKVGRFQILMLVRMMLLRPSPPPFNSKMIEKYCKEILEVLWDKEKSSELFNQALHVISEATDGNLDRDTIHTQVFTSKLIGMFRNKRDFHGPRE